MKSNPVYLLSLIVFPVFVMIFFTSLMSEGQPQSMPVGIVDLDNTSTTRKITRTLDSFQNTEIVRQYPDFNSARQAMQRDEIYGFMYFPKGCTDKLISSRQPDISFYYSYTSLTAGALSFKDFKTAATLGNAAMGSAVMKAKGLTDDQIKTFLQPIVVDFHSLGNPWINYNIYLSTAVIPGCLFLLIFLISAYSIGTELKNNTSKEWMDMAGGSGLIAMTGKFMPQFFINMAVFGGYLFYIFNILEFPHPGGTWPIIILWLLSVVAAQGFGILMFGIYPSLRMSMSVCSLLGVLSFSMAGFAYPVFSMDTGLQCLAVIFPLRHYFIIYDVCILNAFPLSYVWLNFLIMTVFALAPLLVINKIRKAMYEYVYIS
ncbi:MAG: ABC transporter permease [Prevotella sp.]